MSRGELIRFDEKAFLVVDHGLTFLVLTIPC